MSSGALPGADVIEGAPTDRGPAAIVLAAGLARRMGCNKLLLPLHGESLIRGAVGRAIAAGCSPVIVVLGPESVELRNELAGMECTLVTNPAPDGPTSASLHRGIEAVPGSVGSIVVMLADMPLITTEMLASVVDAARTDDAPLVASRYGDVLAPPLMFRRTMFGELLAWHGEGCGKQVVLRHQAEAAYLDWPVASLVDVDTPEDYAALTAKRS